MLDRTTLFIGAAIVWLTGILIGWLMDNDGIILSLNGAAMVLMWIGVAIRKGA